MNKLTKKINAIAIEARASIEAFTSFIAHSDAVHAAIIVTILAAANVMMLYTFVFIDLPDYRHTIHALIGETIHTLKQFI